MKKVSYVEEKNNIYSLPVEERKNKFFELLSQTKSDTETSIRRDKILKEMRGEKIMFVKQVDRDAALLTLLNGGDVSIMMPGVPEPKNWTDYVPSTLSDLLEGCLFFEEEERKRI